MLLFLNVETKTKCTNSAIVIFLVFHFHSRQFTKFTNPNGLRWPNAMNNDRFSTSVTNSIGYTHTFGVVFVFTSLIFRPNLIRTSYTQSSIGRNFWVIWIDAFKTRKMINAFWNLACYFWCWNETLCVKAVSRTTQLHNWQLIRIDMRWPLPNFLDCYSSWLTVNDSECQPFA